jgi:hypothetical protein
MQRGNAMPIILLALLIVLLFGALGFVLHVLWFIAIIVLVLWILGFFLRVGDTVGRRRRRWYRRSERGWYWW